VILTILKNKLIKLAKKLLNYYIQMESVPPGRAHATCGGPTHNEIRMSWSGRGAGRGASGEGARVPLAVEVGGVRIQS
jgi:hypothetical protein